jgi:hypothetical protein
MKVIDHKYRVSQVTGRALEEFKAKISAYESKFNVPLQPVKTCLLSKGTQTVRVRVI